MSRTLDLNKVSKAQKARKEWELLQERLEKEKNGEQLGQTNLEISSNRSTSVKRLKKTS